MHLVDVFYSLVTDLYEWGWGQSFHFSPQLPHKGLRESEVAHETRIAAVLGLKPGMKALDCGCGVGGPMRTIAAVSGAHVTGITINEYQVNRAKSHNAKVRLNAAGPPARAQLDWLQSPPHHRSSLPAPQTLTFGSGRLRFPPPPQQGLAPITDVVRGDFTNMPFEPNTFDAAYAIEATCHANKVNRTGGVGSPLGWAGGAESRAV